MTLPKTLDWTATLQTVANTAKDQLTRNAASTTRILALWEKGTRLAAQDALDSLVDTVAVGDRLVKCRTLSEALAVQGDWLKSQADRRARRLTTWLNLTTAMWSSSPVVPIAARGAIPAVSVSVPAPIPEVAVAAPPVAVQAAAPVPPATPLPTPPTVVVPPVSEAVVPLAPPTAVVPPTVKARHNGRARAKDTRPAAP